MTEGNKVLSSVLENAVFPMGPEYVGKSGWAFRNYGISVKAFLEWYMNNCPSFEWPVCLALDKYLGIATNGVAITNSWRPIMQELFSVQRPERTLSLRGWSGRDNEDEVRKEYVEKLLKREDRILVCAVWIL